MCNSCSYITLKDQLLCETSSLDNEISFLLAHNTICPRKAEVTSSAFFPPPFTLQPSVLIQVEKLHND